jgi:hypothetical protein
MDFIYLSLLPPDERVSQCHPEAVAEGSRICKGVQSLDSSPAAQNDIRVTFDCGTAPPGRSNRGLNKS